jgi:hypothetical protein
MSNPIRDLTIDELESVSGGSYYVSTSASEPLTLKPMMCTDTSMLPGDPFCYFW